MLNTDLDRKIFMAQSFLDMAAFLERSPDFTRAKSDKEAEARFYSTQLGKKSVTYFLYAVIFEISIKIIWEMEQGKESPHSHNIFRLYKELTPASQQKISDMYDTQVSNMKIFISEISDLANYNWDLQSLEDALKINEKVLIDFKYDGKTNEKSSVFSGMLWTDDKIILIPQSLAKIVIFPETLLDYAISLS